MLPRKMVASNFDPFAGVSAAQLLDYFRWKAFKVVYRLFSPGCHHTQRTQGPPLNLFTGKDV